MTENTPEERDEETDTDNGIDNDMAGALNELDVDPDDAPLSLVRVLQLAAARDGTEVLANGDVWFTELDDWAFFVNGGDETVVEDYSPWGEFNIEPITAVAFRTGIVAGAADGNTSEFREVGYRSEEELLVEAIEGELDELDAASRSLRRVD